jgi:hypothetical protein
MRQPHMLNQFSRRVGLIYAVFAAAAAAAVMQ